MSKATAEMQRAYTKCQESQVVDEYLFFQKLEDLRQQYLTLLLLNVLPLNCFDAMK